MQIPYTVMIFLVTVSHAVSHTAQGLTSVAQVIEFMKEMVAAQQEEKHQEEVQWAEYKTFCETTTGHTFSDIAESKQQAAMLQTEIEKAGVHIEKLSKEISVHQADKTAWEANIRALDDFRSKQIVDNRGLAQDYTESVDALKRAIATLEAEDYSRSQAPGNVSFLLQLDSLPPPVKDSLARFLASGSHSNSKGPETPEAYGYEFQSGDILTMLDKLLVKFGNMLKAAQQKESDDKHKYETTRRNFEKDVASASADIQRKGEAKSNTQVHKADLQQELELTQNAHDSDSTYVSEVQATCESKASDFMARRDLRDEEIKSLQQAIAILSSDVVAGAAEHLPVVALQVTRTALAAIRGAQVPKSMDWIKVKDFLAQRARILNSKALEKLTAHIRKEDPFANVTKMIEDLIAQLKTATAEDVDHEAWCDSELDQTNTSRTQKEDTASLIEAEMDSLTTAIADLTAQVSALSQQVKETNQAMLEATKIRREEKATNAETVQEAQKAQEAMTQATAILMEFYSKAATATALVQQHRDAPPIFEAPFQGDQSNGNSIIALLETITKDFARIEADTKAAEETAEAAYKDFGHQSELDNKAATKDISYKTKSIAEKKVQLAKEANDHEANRKELLLVNEYYEKLKPSCVDADRYDEYLAQRAEEIKSLEEALEILKGESNMVQ